MPVERHPASGRLFLSGHFFFLARPSMMAAGKTMSSREKRNFWVGITVLAAIGVVPDG